MYVHIFTLISVKTSFTISSCIDELDPRGAALSNIPYLENLSRKRHIYIYMCILETDVYINEVKTPDSDSGVQHLTVKTLPQYFTP